MSSFTVTAATRVVSVIDPNFRGGLLQIPLAMTLATKGRDEWLDGRLRNKDLSLCCLFQRGRCHAQERCHQVHANTDFVAAMRIQQTAVVSCCRHCGDTATLAPHAAAFFAAHVPAGAKVHVASPAGTTVVDADRLAFTVGLVQQFEEHGCRAVGGVLPLPARRVCRLHLRAACKYGKDCKNVHVCSALGEALVMGANAAAVRPLPPLVRQPAAPSRFGLMQRCEAEPPLLRAPPAVDEAAATAPAPCSVLVFDAARALENSAVEDDGECDDGATSDGGFSSRVAGSPGPAARRSRRASGDSSASSGTATPQQRVLSFDAWHPCSGVAAHVPLQIAGFEQMDFFRFFA